MKKFIFIAIFYFLFFLTIDTVQAQTVACNADLTLVIKDGMGNVVSGASFEIYNEALDVNGLRKPATKLATGKIDAMLGRGVVKFKVTEIAQSYIIKIKNPDLKNRDYYFFDRVLASCGYADTVNVTLSTARIKIVDSQSNLMKKTSFSVWSQGQDANTNLAGIENLGTFSTGDLGYVDVLMPTRDRSLSDNNFYLLNIKGPGNKTFYEYTVSPQDQGVIYLEARISDLLVLVKDASTNQTVPNFKLTIAERIGTAIGGYGPAKASNTIITDDKGRAFIQLPAGFYVLTYLNKNKEPQNFYVEIVKGRRTDFPLFISNFTLSPCDFKSNLNLVFKDYEQRLLGNIDYNLYTQQLDADGWYVPSAKKASGKVSEYGIANTSLTSNPSDKYLLEVCPQRTKDGCFWFPNIHFTCSANLTLENFLPTTDIVLRDLNGKLLVGEKFKLYQRSKDVDGNIIADKNLLLGTFTTLADGKITLYLPSHDIKGYEQSYLIVVEQKNKKAPQADFTVVKGQDSTLEYLVGDNILTLKNPVSPVLDDEGTVQATGKAASAKMLGRIYLQVEERGEAWYINPVNGLRYYLGSAKEAYELMRRLGHGISNKDLAKIDLVVDGAIGIDSDGDGVTDRIERSLGTNPQNSDSDGDGYDDYQEIISAFNPLGNGPLPLNRNFAAKQSGKILLQVESLGEAWYVNPLSLRRYYLADGNDAYRIMRQLGQGITNADLAKIEVGKF